MMSCWTFAAVVLAQLTLASPATELVSQLAQNAGARVQQLGIDMDPAVGPDRSRALQEAIEATELFVLVSREKASAVLRLRMVSPHSMRAELVDSAGDNLWAGLIDWPEHSGSTGSPEPAQAQLARNIMHFARNRVQVVPLRSAYGPLPFGGARWDSPSRDNPALWAAVAPSRQPTGEREASGWTIVRGDDQPIDEAQLARLAGDEALAREIEERRFWPQTGWRIGLGGIALAGAGAGVYLSQKADRDMRAVGFSLLTTGVVSGILTILLPTLAPHHVLSVEQAEQLASAYNDSLRKSLNLSKAAARAVDAEEPSAP